MSTWNPEQYLLFEEERTRPCRDLVSRIRLDDPASVIDLGCGAGNSTRVLAERWPNARITGIDSSAEMLDKARHDDPQREWLRGEIAEWASGGGAKYDVVFSNAALQWVDNHAAVYPTLLARVAAGGVLAIQVPYNLDSPAQRIMSELALSGKWRSKFPAGGVKQWYVHDVGFYYDLCAPLAAHVDLWETTYLQIMPSVQSIAEWYKSTGMRPFLSGLDDTRDRESFVADYVDALRSEFRPRPNGRVLFPFRRLFLIARRAPL